jgi:two-component system response regulator HydG
MVKEGRSREDLFYRLKVLQIDVPPLRERREDILPLARYFLKQNTKRLKLPDLRLAPECLDLLVNHSWPGNVRELENSLEQASVLCTNNLITMDTLPSSITKPSVLDRISASAPRRSLEEVARDHIQNVLTLTGGNRSETARILKIGEATLYRKLRNKKD